MRLIDVETLQLEEFFHNIPPYAILSHTWGSEEVTFQEHLLATGPDAAGHAHIKRKGGFAKIAGACARARDDGHRYLWCDTNCIDKRSSAELSEAINSMYTWYRDSAVCYAFLADVDGGPDAFEKSRWFTRGWTLQELLAPEKVVFFDGRWEVIGDRSELAQRICDITLIHIGALRDRDSVPEYSIAQRMSWAAGRQTSRPEDVAYCLLGIFDINMPLLYGEGSKAFIRLQQEIIKVYDDHSILVWEPEAGDSHLRSGALAVSPAAFKSCGSIVRNLDIARSPSTVTNVGLSLTVAVIPTSMDGIILVGLNCSRELHANRSSQLGGPPEAVPGRRLQVWIWLWALGYEIYERAHYPASQSFLANSYPTAIRKTQETIFVLTMVSKPPHRVSPILPLSPCSASEAGFLVTLGAGNIHPHTRAYEKAFPFGRFSIAYVQRRARSSHSHVLVYNEKHITLISCAWDDQEHPVSWQETSFINVDQKPPGYGATGNNWGGTIVNDLQCTICPGNGTEVAAQLKQLHERLRELHSRTVLNNNSETSPSIFVERNALRNSYDRFEIVVEIVFRGTQTRMPRFEMSRLFRS